MDPKLYLGIDNCFAAKRWTRPAEWMGIIKDLGLRYIEASADTECDPIYMGPNFTRDWIEDVKYHEKRLGMKVKNVYSGHGTYVTSGLTHYDNRVTLRFRDEWVKKQMDTAQALGAGFGFFAHGFEELLLQDHELYEQKLDELYDNLADLACYARQIGMRYAGLEQMYSPHQPPWTIEGTLRLLKEVWRRSGGAPFYITADLGHMNGQQFFEKPTEQYIRDKISLAHAGKPVRRAWFGTSKARALYLDAAAGRMDENAAVSAILKDVEANPNLFSNPIDWNIDAWMRSLGCYSPIVHLQQSDGKSSPHWPFSREFNEKGIVNGKKVLAALVASYEQPDDPAMPPKCDEIVLTFEPFISTAGSTYDLLDDMKESLAYWRQWIPEDGMTLSEVAKRLYNQDTERMHNHE